MTLPSTPSAPDIPHYAQHTALFSSDMLQCATQGCWLDASAVSFPPAAVNSDTRTLQAGEFFIALKGERFDGHGYLTQAKAHGAIGALINQSFATQLQQNPELQAALQGFPLLIVVDTTQGYLDIACLHRKRFPQCQVIALTGSSGKTTVKEMLQTVLTQFGVTGCTVKNHNNEIGVSQTLLSMTPAMDYMIVEMGMRGKGEIEQLSCAALPTIALVINAGTAHIGRLGSTQAIAEAKAEIFTGLHHARHFLPDHPLYGIYPTDSPLLTQALAAYQNTPSAQEKASILWKPFFRDHANVFQAVPTAQFQFTSPTAPHTPPVTVNLSVGGQHNIDNALAVLTVCDALGLSLPQAALALQSFSPPEGRGNRQPLATGENCWVVQDAYNANPASMQAALSEHLETLQKDRSSCSILVLGAMNELGKHSEHYHRTLGSWLAKQPGLTHVAGLVGVGEEACWILDAFVQEDSEETASVKTATVSTASEASQWLLHTFPLPWNAMTLYLKGSRSFQLEQIPETLTHPQ